MRAVRARWLPIAALLAGLAACAAPEQIRYEERLETTPPPARHAVHGVRLGQLMRSLERLANERLPQALDRGRAVDWRRDEVAEVARAMAESAERIADSADLAQLGPGEREEFAALAAALGARARDLVEGAGALTPDELRARADAMRGTCTDCHVRFRIPGLPDGG
jgi:hypothetical protein